MKAHLALLFLLPGAICKPHSNAISTEGSTPANVPRKLLEDPYGAHIADSVLPEKNDIPRDTAVTKKREEPSQEPQMYTVYVTDERNQEQTNKTLEWLEGITQDKSKISPMTIFPWEDPADIPQDELDKLEASGNWDEGIQKYEVTRGWTQVLLDSAGYETVSKKTDWIRAIEACSKYRTVGMSPVPLAMEEITEHIKSRKVEWGDWQKQEAAGRDLVQTSRYEGSNFEDLKNYIYDKRGGEDIVVYVNDHGVQVDVKDIFKGFEDENDKSSILETRAFMDQSAPHNKRQDHSPDGHGTKVASKIVGHWGTAKDAVLVPVQVAPDKAEDLPLALKVVYGDFTRRRSEAKRKNRKEPKAVVVMSRVAELEVQPGERGLTPDEARKTPIGGEFLIYMRLVFERGIPIVVASGNYGAIKEREVTDTMPAVLEDEDLPVINVGAATLEGKAWPNTQGKGTQDGTRLTMYAVGENVEVHDHVDGKEIRDSGTSIAAPVVGGVLAVHMNYEPWDQSKVGTDRVKEIKRWIRTPESSWERIKNQDPNKPEMQVNMIWNGADKAAHQKTEEENTSKPSAPAPAPETKNEGRTFIVGLEQIGFPHCETFVSPGINPTPAKSCTAKPNYQHSLFFYSLENEDEVESLCTSTLDDFWKAEPGSVGDQSPFDKPSWPAGEWQVKLFGEDFTYNNDGSNPGALWKSGRKIDCSGNLENHDPKSDEWCENDLTKYSGKTRKRRRLLVCKW